MIKACIFDLDGTLTDTLESLTFSVNETLKEMGLNSITSQQCRQFVGNGARVLMECALRASGDAKLVRIEEGMQIYGRIFGENCNYHVAPYDGVAKMLKELKARKISLAVLSNKPHRQAVDVVETIFGTGVFEMIQGQCDEIPRKPDPAGVYQILDRLGAEPGEGIYLGDSEVDMKTGKAAHLLTIGAAWGFRSREILNASGADAVIDHAEELLRFL
ncbi:HAD family hydrolase [Roseburia hominis]